MRCSRSSPAASARRPTTADRRIGCNHATGSRVSARGPVVLWRIGIGCPSIEGLTQVGIAGPRRFRLHSSPRRGHTSTDRDRVDDLPGDLPRPTSRSCLLEKTAIRSPRRQQPLCQGSVHPAPRLRSASGRRDHNHPALRYPPTPYVRKRCAATADRGPDGCRTKHAVLGRSAAPGEGTASRFFGRHDGGATARRSARARIHLIAILRSRPWLEGGVPESRTKPLPVRRETACRRGQHAVQNDSAGEGPATAYVLLRGSTPLREAPPFRRSAVAPPRAPA
jgi:hypothetical protein